MENRNNKNQKEAARKETGTRESEEKESKETENKEIKNKETESQENGRGEKWRRVREVTSGMGSDLARVVLFWGTGAVLAAAVGLGLDAKLPRQQMQSSSEAVQEVSSADIGTFADTSMPAVQKVSSADTGRFADTSMPAVQEASSAGTGVSPESVRADAGGDAAERTKPSEHKTVALTFDDGPHAVYTERLLDGLLERGIQATFFVVGKNIAGKEALIERMEAEGHLIGNHTYDHVKICDMKAEDACMQVEKTSALVRELTGHDTEFVRPPFGEWNNGLECSFVMIPVLWNVDPLDWTTEDTSLVVDRVLRKVEDQDIILLHDCFASSVEAALQIADTLQAEGYEFVTVDQLILD